MKKRGGDMGQGGVDFALMVGSRVRAARKELGLTQEKLSRHSRLML